MSVSSSPILIELMELLLSTVVSPPPLSSMHALAFESRSETMVRCTYGKVLVSNITYGVLHDVVHEDVEHEVLENRRTKNKTRKKEQNKKIHQQPQFDWSNGKSELINLVVGSRESGVGVRK